MVSSVRESSPPLEFLEIPILRIEQHISQEIFKLLIIRSLSVLLSTNYPFPATELLCWVDTYLSVKLNPASHFFR